MSLLLASLVGGLLLGPGVNLEWSAPAGCPAQAQVLADVDRLLGGRPLAQDVAVQAAIVREGDGHAATVTIDRAAPRTLRARECVALARAVALVIAVAVDPVALAERSLAEQFARADAAVIVPPPIVPGPPPLPVAPDEPGEPAPAIVASPPTSAASRPASAEPLREPPREPPRLRHAIGVRGGLLIGATRLPTGAAGLVYSLDRGLLRVEARALYATPRRLEYADGIGARVQALTLGALACVAPELPRVRFPLCLGLEAGPMIARAVGVSAPRVRADLWAAGLAGVGLVASLHPRVGLVIAAEFAVALRRPGFHIGDRMALARASTVGARALVGLEFYLPGP